jgi:hypothetical protein
MDSTERRDPKEALCIEGVWSPPLFDCYISRQSTNGPPMTLAPCMNCLGHHLVPFRAVFLKEVDPTETKYAPTYNLAVDGTCRRKRAGRPAVGKLSNGSPKSSESCVLSIGLTRDRQSITPWNGRYGLGQGETGSWRASKIGEAFLANAWTSSCRGVRGAKDWIHQSPDLGRI